MHLARSPLPRVPILSLLALSILSACGSSGVAADSAAAGAQPGPPGNSAGGSSSGTDMGGGGGAALPPEKNIESNYVSPVATGHYVWVANPTSGRVAFIDATSLEIRVVEAGHAPTYLAALTGAPGGDSAIVLNVLSKDATVLRADPSGALSTKTLDLPSAGNAWAVSKDARWAIAWTNSARVMNADPVDGFQDLTVLDLRTGAETSTALSVGYRPVAISFDAALTRAFVVTQDGISVIALDAQPPQVTRNIKITDKPGQTAAARSVAITPDGAYALIRRDGVSQVSVLSLADGVKTDVPLPGAATGLALTPDGSVAVAVLRDSGQAALLPIPGVLQDPTKVSLVAVGDAMNVVGSVQIGEASSTAFLYTSAVPNPRLSVFDASSAQPAPRQILLRAPIAGVFPTPDASHAIVLHATAPSDPASGKLDSRYKAAISVVPVAQDLPAKILGLDAPAVSVAIAPAGDRALVASGDEATSIYRAYVAAMPSLQIQSFELQSMPLAAGIVAGAERGFVAQKHPDGRITFIHLQTGEARTLTGFELASQVVYGNRAP